MFKNGPMSQWPKALARDLVAKVFWAFGVSHPTRVCSGKLLILTFHRVLPESLRKQYPLPGLAVTPEELRWVLAELSPHFAIHTVSDAVRAFRERLTDRPLLAVSFDDGQWDNLHYAAPVLDELGVRATFYIPTDFIGSSRLLWHDEAGFAWLACRRGVIDRSTLSNVLHHLNVAPESSVAVFLEALKNVDPTVRERTVRELYSLAGFAAPDWSRLMTWQEVAVLKEAGHEIGSHGCSHAVFPQLDAQALRRELEQSMQAISGMLGGCVQSLCYPNGSYDQRCIEASEWAGYENAVTTRWGLNHRDQPRFELKRCDMDARRLVDRHGRLSRARLAIRLSGHQPGLNP